MYYILYDFMCLISYSSTVSWTVQSCSIRHGSAHCRAQGEPGNQLVVEELLASFDIDHVESMHYTYVSPSPFRLMQWSLAYQLIQLLQWLLFCSSAAPLAPCANVLPCMSSVNFCALQSRHVQSLIKSRCKH